jgi:hypothetical protein
MGREALCTCDWAGKTAEVKALLETGEIILRGAMRKRIPFSEIKDAKAEGGRLCLAVGGETVRLSIGPVATKWAATINSPPPTVARKLGITDKTVVRLIGEACDEALTEALDKAAKMASKDAGLILACVDSPQSLHRALRDAKAQLLKGVPIWMVYRKGPGHPIDGMAIRSLLRENGMIDTKVASVSAKFTALRFILRKTG